MGMCHKPNSGLLFASFDFSLAITRAQAQKAKGLVYRYRMVYFSFLKNLFKISNPMKVSDNLPLQHALCKVMCL